VRSEMFRFGRGWQSLFDGIGGDRHCRYRAEGQDGTEQLLSLHGCCVMVEVDDAIVRCRMIE
jgi:hypothetical protein